MVGYAEGPQIKKEAFLYAGGSMTALGFLAGGTESQANAINSAGQIVGYSTNASGHVEAFVVRGGSMTGLGTLPGYTDSVALAINDKGQIVGYAGSNNVADRAFLYSDGVMAPLPALYGGNYSAPLGIDNDGQVVGTAGGTNNEGQAFAPRAFLYRAGHMYDLNSLAPGAGNVLDRAIAINDSGQILATGYWLLPSQPLGPPRGSSSENCLLTPPPLTGAVGGFVPTTPRRIADTRTSQTDGCSFAGGGPIVGFSSFFISPNCEIPATAYAYAMNVTAVPGGPLGYLALEGSGVSTLNSWQGNVVANAAIVQSDASSGAISVYASDRTDVMLDVNGYFDTTKGDVFYPVTPYRVSDTRNPADPLGGPLLAGFATRTIPVLSAPCGLPSSATAYSMNLTAVPRGSLDFLTTWAAGQPRPYVSSLNSSTGNAVANAAIVGAGAAGATSVYATNPTDLIIDVNGYFAPAGSPGGLTFYPIPPCRVADTRKPDGPLGGPALASRTPRSFPIPAAGSCGFVPPEAKAYSLNVTAVPDGALSYLTVWPAGTPKPWASTLNSWDGAPVANAAIVAAGDGGAISIYATDPTHVILDINGYFAP